MKNKKLIKVAIAMVALTLPITTFANVVPNSTPIVRPYDYGDEIGGLIGMIAKIVSLVQDVKKQNELNAEISNVKKEILNLNLPQSSKYEMLKNFVVSIQDQDVDTQIEIVKQYKDVIPQAYAEIKRKLRVIVENLKTEMLNKKYKGIEGTTTLINNIDAMLSSDDYSTYDDVQTLAKIVKNRKNALDDQLYGLKTQILDRINETDVLTPTQKDELRMKVADSNNKQELDQMNRDALANVESTVQHEFSKIDKATSNIDYFSYINIKDGFNISVAPTFDTNQFKNVKTKDDFLKLLGVETKISYFAQDLDPKLRYGALGEFNKKGDVYTFSVGPVVDYSILRAFGRYRVNVLSEKDSKPYITNSFDLGANINYARNITDKLKFKIGVSTIGGLMIPYGNYVKYSSYNYQILGDASLKYTDYWYDYDLYLNANGGVGGTYMLAKYKDGSSTDKHKFTLSPKYNVEIGGDKKIDNFKMGGYLKLQDKLNLGVGVNFNYDFE